MGRRLLLSVALGTAPIVGCTPGAATRNAEPDVQVVIAPAERALFDRAARSGDIALIERFIRSYPDSSLVRRLLVNLPPETLAQIDRATLAVINPSIVRSLPRDTRFSLGLDIPSAEGMFDGSPPADGYAG